MKALRAAFLTGAVATFTALSTGGLMLVKAGGAPPAQSSGSTPRKGAARPPQATPKEPSRVKPAATPQNRAKSVGERAGPPAPLQTGPAGVEALEFADAFPSEPRPLAPDLQLAQEGLKRAEAQAAFAKALVAEDNAEADAALAGYRRVLELDPSYADLAVKVAYELARRNDVAGGIQVLKDAIKAAPTEPLPLIYLSQLYSKYLKKPDLALKYAEQAVALAPDNFNAHNAMFDLYVATGESKKAEEILARAGKSKSADAKFWVQVGDLHTRLYLKEDGESQPAELERMNGIYRKAAELGKSDPTIQAKVGDYFVLSRQVQEAIPFYLAALSSPSDADESGLANLRDKLARAFLVTDQRDEAIKLLEQVVAEKPLRFETHELLGDLYQQKGEMGKALASYEQSLKLDGTRPDNYLRVAQLYLRQKNADKAAEVMREARAKFPGHAGVTSFLGFMLSQANRHTEAMTAFAEAQADAENSQEEMLNADFYLQYGAAAERAGLMERAAELLREAIRLDPQDSAEACNYLGYMWIDRGMNLDEAGELIARAVEAKPDNGAFLDSLGWFYFKKGDTERALKELLRAAELIQPEDAGEVYDHIGDTFEKLGKPAEALSYWQKALALDAENKKIAAKIEAANPKVTRTAPAAPAVTPP